MDKSNTQTHLSFTWLIKMQGMWLGFIWGFAEAILFFIVPDVIMTFVALFFPRKIPQYMGMVLIGSLLGGFLLFNLSQINSAFGRRLVLSVPFVSPAMLESAQRDFLRNGAWALCKGPLSGIPYKVYAVEAPRYCRLPGFLAISVLARLERILPSSILFIILGRIFNLLGKRARSSAVTVHLVFWVITYAYYWTR